MVRKLIVFSILLTLLSGALQAQAVRAQAMHGIPDPAMDPADVYVSLFGSVVAFLDDIDFRQVGENFESPIAGITIDIGIAPGNSGGVGDVLISFPIPLETGRNYIGVARGVVNPANFAPNPDGIYTGLDFSLTNEARLVSSTPGSAELNLAHLVSDAPTVDFYLSDGTLLYDNVRYGDIAPYVAVTPGIQILEMRDASGTNVLGMYQVDLTNYADSALFVMVSGFLDPSSNQNGEALALQAVLPSDVVIPFVDVSTAIGDGDFEQPLIDFRLLQNYPNPFNPTTTIEYQMVAAGQVSLKVFDISGREIATLVSEQRMPGNYKVQWDGYNSAGAPVSSGVYLYRLTANNVTETRKMMLLR